MFVHNGEIMQIGKLRRDMVTAVAPELFENMLGSTDSEVMFHLALTFGLGRDRPGALARRHDVPDPIWATIAVTDGNTLYCVRYASDGDAPSLHYIRDVQELYALNPAAADKLGTNARAVVSEPIGSFAQVWAEAPQGSLMIVRDGQVNVQQFWPEAT